MKYLPIIFVSLLIFSCSTTKKVQQLPPPPKDTAIVLPHNEKETIATVFKKMNHIDFTTFSGKVEVAYSNNGKSNDFDAKIQIQKGNTIWLSITGPLGIELARGLITQDSVKILNRLQREYTATSISYLQKQIGLPLNFTTLQDLLLGNPIFLNEEKSHFEPQQTNILVTSEDNEFKNVLTLLLPGYLPKLSLLTDAKNPEGRNATLTYDNYQQEASYAFSTERNIQVKYKSDINIQMKFKNYQFNQQVNMPFSIPGGYSRK